MITSQNLLDGELSYIDTNFICANVVHAVLSGHLFISNVVNKEGERIVAQPS